MRKRWMCCFLVAVFFRGLVTVLGVGKGGEGSASGSGIFDKDVVLAVQDEQFSLNLTDMILPVCGNNQLLSYNGSELTCSDIPERHCVCPSPMVGSGEPPTQPPEPPGGCPVFEPPAGGAFVCLPNTTVIHCSVLCDSSREFYSTPFNPYHCGEDTKFRWEDFTRLTHTSLPECSGFRYSPRPLHRSEFYLPTTCPLVLENQAQADTVKNAFCDILMDFVDRDKVNCTPTTVFIQCPPIGVALVVPPDHPNLNP